MITAFRVPSSLSLNAAVFAAVILASRLPSADHVFAFVAWAVNWFGLEPQLRRYLATSASRTANALLAAMDICIVALTLGLSAAFVSARFAVGVAVALLAVSVGAPVWLLHLQPQKLVFSGPWDEATPDLQ